MKKISYISKRLHPHLYEYYRVGGFDTWEGRKYYKMKEHWIMMELTSCWNLFNNRARSGGNKKIHMPETEPNPPTPFLLVP